MTTETIDYRGYQIRIDPEECPENPFEAWDSEPDLIAASWDLGRAYVKAYGSTEYEYLPELTANEIRANTADICRETETRSLLHLIDEHAPNYRYDYSTAADAVNDALQGYYADLGASDRLEFLSFVLGLKGIVSLCTSVHGYSQGDYAELLIIASPAFLERTGAVIESPEQLRYAAELYAAWAFGDVYYYTVEDEDGGTIDSCGGFYGSDHEDSGLLESARDAIDAEIRITNRKHANQLKQMIRNHVPLYLRESLLAN